MKPIFKVLICIVAILFVVSPLIVYCLTLHNEDFAEKSSDFGIFGDYIGGTVGTIIGAISIYLVYITYTSQVKFARRQDESMKRQQFETTYFSLLEQQQMIRSQLKGTIGDETYEGIFYLQNLKLQLSDALSELNYIQNEITEDNKVMLKNRVNSLYLDFFLPNVSNLGHFFRHLYHILKHIEDSNMPDARKYADLLQSQLSNDELYLLAINGISNYGRRKMLPLMDKYGLLENYNANGDMLIVKLLSIFYKQTKSKYLMFKNGKIIFVGGVHGVGKSTFSAVVKQKCRSIECLSCSKIIKWENPSHKEVENVEETQDALLANLPYFIDQDKNYLLDGHFCLLTEQGTIERVPMEVFEVMSLSLIIVLKEEPAIICQRLNKRDSHNYPIELVTNFQEEELKYAAEVADTLGISLEICDREKSEDIIEYLKLQLNDNAIFSK